jgi:hypothetical protein
MMKKLLYLPVLMMFVFCNQPAPSIKEQKEKKIKDSLEIAAIAKSINDKSKKDHDLTYYDLQNVESEIKDVNTYFENAGYFASLDGVKLGVDELQRLQSRIAVGIRVGDSTTVYAEKVDKKLASARQKVLPKLRSNYIKFLNKELWVDNYKVKGSGTTIKFYHFSFVDNKNKQDFIDACYSLLQQLNFKRAEFDYTDNGYGEGTYYTIDSGKDSDPIEYD